MARADQVLLKRRITRPVQDYLVPIEGGFLHALEEGFEWDYKDPVWLK